MGIIIGSNSHGEHFIEPDTTSICYMSQVKAYQLYKHNIILQYWLKLAISNFIV